MTKADTQIHRSALKSVLLETDKSDFYIQYLPIALSFPSAIPHAYSHDIPAIDYKELDAWSAVLGFVAQPLQDETPEEYKHYPLIRFTAIKK